MWFSIQSPTIDTDHHHLPWWWVWRVLTSVHTVFLGVKNQLSLFFFFSETTLLTLTKLNPWSHWLFQGLSRWSMQGHMEALEVNFNQMGSWKQLEGYLIFLFSHDGLFCLCVCVCVCVCVCILIPLLWRHFKRTQSFWVPEKLCPLQ